MFLIQSNIELVSPSVIVWSICVGANIAFIASFFSRNVTGKLVRSMLSNAIGISNAKTLFELGSRSNWFTRSILKNGSTLRNIVSVVGDAIPTRVDGEKLVPDFENARFYIKEANILKAKNAYGAETKWYLLLIFIVISIGAAYLMSLVMPWFLDVTHLNA